MGLLCDFFSATPERAASVDPERWLEVADSFDVLASGGIEPMVTFGVLEEVLVGTPFDDTLEADVRVAESGECWIYSLRAPLLDALSEDRNDWAAVAERWVATGEVSGARADDLAVFLGELSGFVRRSRERGEQVHTWGSL